MNLPALFLLNIIMLLAGGAVGTAPESINDTYPLLISANDAPANTPALLY